MGIGGKGCRRRDRGRRGLERIFLGFGGEIRWGGVSIGRLITKHEIFFSWLSKSIILV